VQWINNTELEKEMPINERIIFLLKCSGWKAAQLCAEKGIDYGTLYKTMKGISIPRFDFVEKLCKAIPNANPDFLLRGVGSPTLEGAPVEQKPPGPGGNEEMMRQLLSVFRQLVAAEKREGNG
jgi:transcriptional regulator with XRE-family HTH domain